MRGGVILDGWQTTKGGDSTEKSDVLLTNINQFESWKILRLPFFWGT